MKLLRTNFGSRCNRAIFRTGYNTVVARACIRAQFVNTLNKP